MRHPTELLKAADIAAMEGKSKAHLLNPDAIRVSKSLGGATGLTSLGFHMMTVMPGREYAEYHRHLYEEQCFYILAGRGEAIIEEQHHAIGPGDFLGFPKRLYMNGTEEALVDLHDVKIEPSV